MVLIWTRKQAHIEPMMKRQGEDSRLQAQGRVPEQIQSCQHCDFQLPVIQQSRETTDFCCLSIPSVVLCHGSPSRLIQKEEKKRERLRERKRLREREKFDVKLYIHLDNLTLRDMHKSTCLPFPSPFYRAEGLYSMRLIETSQNMQMERRARCQEPDSSPTGGLGGRWDLPSGSPLWTSGLPPCARRRSGRWQSGTESHGRCLGACLGKWKA